MRPRLTSRTLTLSLVALASLCSNAARAQDTLSVMSFGGAYQEALRKAVFETYAAQTVKVTETMSDIATETVSYILWPRA